jgi:mono/diheme cytochrome c family protein
MPIRRPPSSRLVTADVRCRGGLRRGLRLGAAALLTAVLTLTAGACGGSDGGGAVASGKSVYDKRCATCHGGRGQGFVGPPVGGGRMVTKYPEVADMRAIIVDGRNQMPPWGNVLSVEEIDAVVQYVRDELGR